MPKKNFAFVFPGQGAQYVGMAKDFYDLPEYRHFFEESNEKLGLNLTSIMFDGPLEKLKQTQFTQPAILLHSIIAHEYFRQHIQIIPAFTAGHSLGEFTALVASGALNWQDALYLVHKRGTFMIEASQGTPYKMAAILGLDGISIRNICDDIDGVVVAANFNTPVQTVISGEEKAVDMAMEECKNAGAKRIVELIVGGAFHSPLIQRSAEWLHKEMLKIDFSDTIIPVVANYTAQPETKKSEIIDNLTQQIISPVQWVRSVEYMIENGVDTFIEFGPGQVVSGMVKAICRNTHRYHINTLEDAEKVITALKAL
ncbi:MAG TPA: [acyl-carrier-protein] S-malonyltransferase [Candidatus Cloacimonetes bacterium]|nr:[acyl-carrier-protein] S-malonyltransferase [Candidatus Cloacimonadota bacterium]HEX37398.1 [acyl-carrier-protein] S-malonyltransferase [Candidatus Cloacimonadota bacterium]